MASEQCRIVFAFAVRLGAKIHSRKNPKCNLGTWDNSGYELDSNYWQANKVSWQNHPASPRKKNIILSDPSNTITVSMWRKFFANEESNSKTFWTQSLSHQWTHRRCIWGWYFHSQMYVQCVQWCGSDCFQKVFEIFFPSAEDVLLIAE